MREIKFRSWDKALKQMNYSSLNAITFDGRIYYGNADFTDYPQEIMQYTGLKDKNGKEIFEGDICRYYNPEDKDGICEIEEDYALWISGTIKETNLLTPLFYLKCSSEWEVIGNIHENPELL